MDHSQHIHSEGWEGVTGLCMDEAYGRVYSIVSFAQRSTSVAITLN